MHRPFACTPLVGSHTRFTVRIEGLDLLSTRTASLADSNAIIFYRLMPVKAVRKPLMHSDLCKCGENVLAYVGCSLNCNKGELCSFWISIRGQSGS